MSAISMSLLPCSMMFCVCLVCSTVCQSLASLNSLNPFHWMKTMGMPIPPFLDNPFDLARSLKIKDGFMNINTKKNKKIKDTTNDWNDI